MRERERERGRGRGRGRKNVREKHEREKERVRERETDWDTVEKKSGRVGESSFSPISKLSCIAFILFFLTCSEPSFLFSSTLFLLYYTFMISLKSPSLFPRSASSSPLPSYYLISSLLDSFTSILFISFDFSLISTIYLRWIPVALKMWTLDPWIRSPSHLLQT